METLARTQGEIGQNVRGLRLRRALTQEELADAAGVSSAAITKIELGRRVPRPGTLRKIAAALRVPVEQLTE
ncbi:MAG: helix-turn-helix domain-containing protein [Actinomycetota bacterium]|nr:helix-turn-helix domain-containing protein [Actinomycetota bacterium]